MANKESVFISPDAAQQNTGKFEFLIGIENEKKEIVKDGLYNEWYEIIPSSFGDEALPSAFGPFVKGYKDALSQNTLENYVESEIANKGYGGIYRAISDSEIAKTNADRKVVAAHTPSSLHSVSQNLDEFMIAVQDSNLNANYKAEYDASIENERRYLRQASALTTPEFTSLQKTPEQWGKFIDSEKSKTEGTIVLPLEKEALQILEKSKLLPKRDINVKDALSLWELSDEEESAIGIEQIADDAKKLNPTQGAKLMAVILNRLGLSDWKVQIDDNSASVSVNPKEKLIKFPSSREFVGMDVINIPSHELMHAVRAQNGEKQGLGLLKEGVNDYLPTEEGVGAVAEMVMGEPFGDPRQVKFAARYLASAMALKADIDDKGAIVARYSPQEIYETLKEYGVEEIDSADIVWRIMRGTSLLHKTTFVEVDTENGNFTLPAAECYAKDTVYFKGQMQVFTWIKDHMPLDSSSRIKNEVTLGSQDFSTKLLARVGLSREKMEIDANHTEPISSLKKRYNDLVGVGRQTLIDILNIHGAGKMRLDFLDDGSPWYDLLKFGEINGLVDYGKILKPQKIIDIEKFLTTTE